MKVERTETEDGRYKFEISRERTTLVIVFGSAYANCRVRVPSEDGWTTENYLDVINNMLAAMPRDNSHLLLPKVRHYDDDDPTDNEIDVYEFYT